MSYQDNNNEETNYNSRYSLYELQTAIEKIPSDKSCGKDEVHNQFIKHLPHTKLQELLGNILIHGYCIDSLERGEMGIFLQNG